MNLYTSQDFCSPSDLMISVPKSCPASEPISAAMPSVAKKANPPKTSCINSGMVTEVNCEPMLVNTKPLRR
ncbi:MAG: hypothetical protein A3G41_03730 [Elusimicrobia bacterium RIFCSPLOWO2_12_FULL_59_9]|nr:MAG: hypothetical protein A3G41_03730 [Elusimicrobia bacterium RIFCSPLOWO2_12_FULL_59_9]